MIREGSVPDPEAVPQITSEVVLRALKDAENLIRTSGPTSAVDRVHTVLHGYLQAVCDGENIAFKRDDSMVALLRKLEAEHPKLADLGPRSQDIKMVLNSRASIRRSCQKVIPSSKLCRTHNRR
jgi:hypothetical protein